MVHIADVNLFARGLDLRVAAHAEIRIALDEHFLVDRTVRIVTNDAAFAHGRVFEDIGLWQAGNVAVMRSGMPEQIRALRVTDGTLSLLEVRAELGRLIAKEKENGASRRHQGYRNGGPDSGTILRIDVGRYPTEVWSVRSLSRYQ